MIQPVDNDAARHELTEALALVHEHMAELAAVETQRAVLSATATAADGTVVVTVNTHGVVSHTDVDESYLDDYDLADLGNYVTAAAQEAAHAVERQSAELLALLAERRARFPSLADIVDGAPDIRDLLSHLHRVDPDHDREETSDYPTVRSER
jgi:DNA-binding protein YbaB